MRLAYSAEETETTPSYYWDNALRGVRQAVVQLTLSGRCFFEADGERRLVQPGQAFVTEVPSATVYGYPEDGDQPYVHRFIAPHGEAAVALARRFRLSYGPVIDLAKRPESYSLFREIAERADGRRFRDRFEESVLLYQFFAALFREASTAEARGDPIVACYQRIQNRYREPFNVSEIARDAGVSREHLAREFRARYGQSPSQLLRGLRLTEAKLLIRTGVSDLERVAMSSGFTDVRALKRLLG